MSTLPEDDCGWTSTTDASPLGSLLATGPHHPPRWVRRLPSSHHHHHNAGHEKRWPSTVPDSQVEVHGEEKRERGRLGERICSDARGRCGCFSGSVLAGCCEE